MKISSTHIIQWTQQLSLLLNSHLPLCQALYLLSTSNPNESLCQLSQHLYQDISDGIPLSYSLNQFPTHFDETYRQLVKAGEESGRLSIILQRIAHQKKIRNQVDSQIMKALMYPGAVLLVGIAVTLLLLLYVVPQISLVFLQFNQPLPVLTEWILFVSSLVIRLTFPLFILFLLTSITSYLCYHYFHGFKLFISRAIWNSPIGFFYQYSGCVLFSSTLSTLLYSGLPIAHAFSTSIEVISHPYAKQRLRGALQLIYQGHSFYYALQQTYLFPPLALHLWKMGEYTGKLGELLDDTALYYQEQLNTLTHQLTQWIEPFLLIILGILIGTIVVAMYLPLFNLGLVIGS